MATIKHGIATTSATVLSAVTIAATSTSVASSEINNTTDRHTGMLLQLEATFPVAPVEGDVLSVYMAYAYDGTNYPTFIGPQNFLCSFAVDDVTTAQIFTDGFLYDIPPGRMKLYVYNSATVSVVSTLKVSRLSKDIV